MNFEEPQTVKRTGMIVGYALSYIFFTVMLYTLLFLLKKLPPSWSVIGIVTVTSSVALLGAIIKRLLK